jgi:hypothetical protein
VLLCLGCTPDPCAQFSGQSCIALEVRGPVSVTQLLVNVTGAFLIVDARTPATPREPTPLPVTLAVLPGDKTGIALLSVAGLVGDVEVGRGTGSVEVAAGQRVAAVVEIGDAVDLAQIPDLAPARDLNGQDLSDVPCDTTTQSPCPADQKCVVTGFEENSCRPAGALPVGALCDPANDQCARTTQCLIPGNKNGVCEQFCGNQADCKQAPVSVGGTVLPDNIGHCIFQVGQNGTSSPRICSVACNPVAMVGASGCPTDAACFYTANGTFPEFTFCGPPGTPGDGESCASSLCRAGFSCLGVGGEVKCRPVCRKDTNSDCPSGYECKPGAAGAASVMFGYCCPTAGC